jgi:hypothetical protein
VELVVVVVVVVVVRVVVTVSVVGGAVTVVVLVGTCTEMFVLPGLDAAEVAVVVTVDVVVPVFEPLVTATAIPAPTSSATTAASTVIHVDER